MKRKKIMLSPKVAAISVLLVWLVLGAFIIELRNTVPGGRKFEDRFPLIGWVWTATVHPDLLVYVATQALKSNHRLSVHDLAPNKDLSSSLHRFLPSRDEFANKYLKEAVPTGRPILWEFLSIEPIIDPSPSRVLVGIEAPGASAGLEWLEPDTEVTISDVKDANRAIKGSIVTTVIPKKASVPAAKKKPNVVVPEGTTPLFDD